jgi:hypothetical protein
MLQASLTTNDLLKKNNDLHGHEVLLLAKLLKDEEEQMQIIAEFKRPKNPWGARLPPKTQEEPQ